MSFPEHQGVAANPLAPRMAVEVVSHSRERARQVHIITVHESHDLASCLCHALVDGLDLPAIFLAYPKRQLLFIAMNYFDAVVAAFAVDDDVLQRFVTLVENRKDRL